MFLHVGNNKNIRLSSVVGIFDMDNATVSAITRKFLGGKQKERLVESASYDIPKSFIVCNWGMDVVVYISQISSKTLLKRAQEEGAWLSMGE